MQIIRGRFELNQTADNISEIHRVIHDKRNSIASILELEHLEDYPTEIITAK